MLRNTVKKHDCEERWEENRCLMCYCDGRCDVQGRFQEDEKLRKLREERSNKNADGVD